MTNWPALIALFAVACSHAETISRLPDPKPEPARAVSAAAPPVFEGREWVTLDELVTELDRVAEVVARSPAVHADYQTLLREHGLDDSAELWSEYVRVRMIFEAARDGGFWGLRWAITNREGSSRTIWKQWQRLDSSELEDGRPTVIAECDELSALFAFLVRQLGVKHAGWLGGGPFHVVAAWTIKNPDGREVRIVVPTSQVFISQDASLGTREIDAYRPKVIWNYWPKDVRADFKIPAPTARYMIEQVLRHGSKSQAELQALRNRRGGS